MLANAALKSENNQKRTGRTYFDVEMFLVRMKKSTLAILAKTVLESLSVISFVVMRKAKCLLHFDHDYEHATKRPLLTEGIVKTPVYSFFLIFVSGFLTRRHKYDRRKASGGLNDNISKNTNRKLVTF